MMKKVPTKIKTLPELEIGDILCDPNGEQTALILPPRKEVLFDQKYTFSKNFDDHETYLTVYDNDYQPYWWFFSLGSSFSNEREVVNFLRRVVPMIDNTFCYTSGDTVTIAGDSYIIPLWICILWFENNKKVPEFYVL